MKISDMTTSRAIRTTLLLSAITAATCSNPPDPPDPSEPSDSELERAVLSMFEEGWSRGRVEVFDSTIADSVLFHYAGTPRRVSRDDLGEIVERWRAAFPDLRMTVDELLVEDDLAAARLTLTGTHEGEWAGAAPTGDPVRMALMMFFRFEDGRMVELWESDDQLGFRRQLGITP